jgi:hypothetical protein
MDAFVGMSAEKHVAGSEFGPLQLAMWKREFENLRDGDRFFSFVWSGDETVQGHGHVENGCGHGVSFLACGLGSIH